MPEADVFEAPPQTTFHQDFLEAITEAFVGNGVLDNGEAEATADSGTAMGVDVSAAPTGITFGGTIYTPVAANFTATTGPTTTTGGQDDRRVDKVIFDSGTGAFDYLEGTADPNPTPPSTPADSLTIALVEVAHEATDLSDGDIHNWRSRPVAGTTGPSGELLSKQGLRVGPDPTTTITETATPTGFTFSADDGIDVHLESDVTIENNSGASATEDVTVTLYDGTDNTGTQLVSETKSISLNDDASTVSTFIGTDQKLDGGDYFIEVTTSGTDLSITQVDEKTQGLQWSFIEEDDGTLRLINRYTGSNIFSVDSFTDEIAFLNAAIDQAEIADGSITTAKLADDAVTAAKVAANAITNEQMADDAVGAAEIKALASGIASVTNPGTFGALFDMPVDSNSTDGTLHSYTFDIDGTNILEIRALSDGAGGVDTLEVRLHQSLNVNGNDIVDGGTTIWSSTDGFVPRAAIDDQIATAATKTASYTTSDEEYVPVDPSGTGGVPITLASADAEDGNEITVQDVGGAAQSNNITVSTEGSENIDGGTSYTIDADFGSATFISDGTNWFVENERGGTVDPRNVFEGTETGNVPAGDQGILVVDSLAPNETVEVLKAALTTDTIEAVPTGVDLELVTFDNAGGFTSQATLITGDGSTVFDRETGNPLASYTNTGTTAESVGVLVDNTTTSAVDVVAKVEGRAPA